MIPHHPAVTPDNTNPPDSPSLAKRLGSESYERRWQRQQSWMNPDRQNSPRLRARHAQHRLIERLLQLTGLYANGRRNFTDVRLTENELRIAGLPPAFDGYRVLQIADLHLDLDPERLTPAILKTLAAADYDVCVNTGDYTFDRTRREIAMEYFEQIANAIQTPMFGVLGNHDDLDAIAPLEAHGLRLLLNEAVPLERNGETLWLTGIDDPHFYRSDNLGRALNQVPIGAPTLLLSHAPSFAVKAAATGRISAMLSGHTHGGQICLPGGIPIFIHCECPRGQASGPWRVAGMPGYTSRGTGGSGVPVRFNCPPEITRHTLRPA